LGTTVRLWWNRFGPMFGKRRLDEVYMKINGEMHYLWRAVD
jgi:putative transposase